MESRRKNESLNQENLIMLLDQLAKEQEQMNKSLLSIMEALTSLSNKSNDPGSNLKSLNVATLTDDLKETREIIKKATIRIETQRGVERKFQVLLFPPQDAKLFYKIVFGRWFLYVIIALVIVKIYQWGIHESDNEMRIKIERINNDKINRAWGHLYKQKSKTLHLLMDSALMEK